MTSDLGIQDSVIYTLWFNLSGLVVVKVSANGANEAGEIFSKAPQDRPSNSDSVSDSQPSHLSSAKEPSFAERNQTSESIHDCTCQCCSNPEIPYHPSDISCTESKIRHSHQSEERKMGQVKSYNRKIQPSWCAKYP